MKNYREQYQKYLKREILDKQVQDYKTYEYKPHYHTFNELKRNFISGDCEVKYEGTIKRKFEFVWDINPKALDDIRTYLKIYLKKDNVEDVFDRWSDHTWHGRFWNNKYIFIGQWSEYNSFDSNINREISSCIKLLKEATSAGDKQKVEEYTEKLEDSFEKFINVVIKKVKSNYIFECLEKWYIKENEYNEIMKDDKIIWSNDFEKINLIELRKNIKSKSGVYEITSSNKFNESVFEIPELKVIKLSKNLAEQYESQLKKYKFKINKADLRNNTMIYVKDSINVKDYSTIEHKVNRKQFKDDDLWDKVFRLMSKFEQDIEYEFRKKFPTTVEYSFIMKDMRKALDEIGKKIYEKGIYKSSK